MMKRYILSTALIFCIGVLCLAQAAEPPFNVEKSRQELEIMKGIIEKSLVFSPSDEANEKRAFRIRDINAFYLRGQGAVFIITIPSYRLGDQKSPDVLLRMDELRKQGELLSQQMNLRSKEIEKKTASLAREFEQNRSQNKDSSKLPPPPPTPPAPPAPPAVPTQPPVPEWRTPERFKGLGAQLKKGMADMHRWWEKLRRTAKSQLIEMLVNHGDSLSVVGPGEYVNLVLVFGEPTGIFDPILGMNVIREVITVRKSWITDYKAGKLSLEDFKQKVVEYSN